ncbi:MAG: hypothetical protein JWM07_309 [Candidatus Saccharibacteria bacterium]|jgi:hypothetical protein|nr:hypothetical protein [Candidatus Saccharibacteria bacterium]
MSVLTNTSGLCAAVVLIASLSVVGCTPQSNGDVQPDPIASVPSHPDRHPTTADVDAGTACWQAPITTIVWKEQDRKYVGKNGWCKYEVK